MKNSIEFLYCACNCGKTLPKVKSRNGIPRRFIHGHNNKNRHFSEEWKRKISIANIGRKVAEDGRKRMSVAKSGENHPMYGKHLSEQCRNKLSIAQTGPRNPMYGKPLSLEHRRKIGLALTNEKHHQWKGDDVGYVGVHAWLRKHFPKPEFCHMCKEKPPREIANITGIYTRDFKNWAYFCRKCHKLFDNSGIRAGLKQKGKPRKMTNNK